MSTSLSRLLTFYGHLEGEELLRIMIMEQFKGKIALISSFGADAALLISMVAEIDKTVPVLFLDTGKHFDETLEYVKDLKKLFGLEDLRYLRPDIKLLDNADKEGALWQVNPDRCCWIRKVEPLERAIKEAGFEAIITGRKGYQTPEREDLPVIEQDEKGYFKINPFISWSRKQFKQILQQSGLPQHPLVAKGFLSIGCAPCTIPVKPGEDERAGRWAHTKNRPQHEQKQECGIHVPGKDDTPDWTV